jgi:proline iminopeptidase
MEARINDTTLFYASVGEGRPLLVMHGGLGWDHTYLRPWLDALGGQAEVIYYDHRGNGRSAAPEDWSAVDHATWADDADALRAHLGFERIILFGHSYGGFLALEYALRHPDRLHGLILCGAGPVFEHQEAVVANAQERGTPEQVETISELLSGPVNSDADLEAGVETILPLYFHRPDEAPLDAIVDEMTFRADAFNRAFFHCLPQYDVRDRLAAIDVPALVLGGRHDWVQPPAYSVEPLHDALPHAEKAIFERSGHCPFIEEPDVFAEVVTDWLHRLA